MQECCFHSLLLSGTVLLSFHSFPLFFHSFFPKWGSPLMQRGVRLPVSFSPPLPFSPASLVYIPLPIFGDLKVPPPPTCVECKHSHLLCSERKQGQLIGTLLIWPWPLSAGWKPCPFVYSSGAYSPLQVVLWLGLYFLPTWLQRWR